MKTQSAALVKNDAAKNWVVRRWRASLSLSMARFSTTWPLLSLTFLACQRPAPTTPAEVTAPSPQPAAPTVRNVIFITVDTLRADVLAQHGGAAATPVLHTLAQRGWWFERAYSVSMLTNPSHVSLMTSLYPRDHGVYDNESGVHDGVRTLATVLRGAGFATGAVIGFPHLNPQVANLGHGFERLVPATRTERRAPETSETALGVIDDLRASFPGAPLFMWVHYADPHAPYEPPASHPPKPAHGPTTPISKAAHAAPGFQRNNPWFRTAFRSIPTVQDMAARYVAEVEATDTGLGDLLQGLAARGLTQGTVVVLTSDHGENLGEHELYFHHGGLYEPTVHVPLVVSFLDGAVAPRRLDGLVSGVDVAPTILDLVGAARWEPMRGRSLVPMATRGAPGRDVVYSEHMLAQALAARTHTGTIIVHRKSSHQFPTYPLRSGTREIYQRGDEATALHPADPTALELQRYAEGFLDIGLKLSARPAVAQDRESLRALGYIE